MFFLLSSLKKGKDLFSKGKEMINGFSNVYNQLF